MYFIWLYCCYCAPSQFAAKIPETLASVLVFQRWIRMCIWDNWDKNFAALCFLLCVKGKGNFTLVLFRAKSFQIGLNHSCYVFGNSSTLYYIIVLAFTAFLGLICVNQVNTHCCFVLAYPHLANTCPFLYVSKFASRTCQCVVHFVQCFHVIVYHVQDIQVYISHSVFIVSHRIDTVHILC